jgi:hypothetical protein
MCRPFVAGSSLDSPRREKDSNPRSPARETTLRDCLLIEEVRFAADLYGAFPVKRLFWVLLIVLCSERERPFFVRSPAIRFPERAEGVKGPKR